ncbi:unnamed protein product [Symbiodinium sp. CCMP2592]|nr:unnamed protein product [Symbiodinium sp. CCMP2592]
MSKRQTAKLRKVAQTSEEQTRRLASLEEASRRPAQDTTMRLEARLSELEGQQASLEEEFRNVVTTGQRLDSLSPSRRVNTRSVHAVAEGPGYDVVRALETELSTLSKQLAAQAEPPHAAAQLHCRLCVPVLACAQLDDHSSALASLRVRTEGQEIVASLLGFLGWSQLTHRPEPQEQRLVAAGERLEKVVAPTLEAFRAELQQLRLADRSEMDQRFEHLSRRLVDSNEEAMNELKDVLQDHRERDPTSEAAVSRLRETCAVQDQQLRRLEALLDPSLQREEELCGLMVRVEGLEHRLELIDEEAVSEKADRTELHRLDLAVKEISEPLRRLSQRTATNETRTSNLEHQLDQLQADHSTVPIPATTPGSESFATKASLEALSEELGQAVVRIVEVEAVVQRPPAIAAPASEAVVLEAASRIDAVESSVKVLQEQMEHGLDLLKLQDLPARSTSDEAVQLEELSARVSKALKLAENSGSNMQSLRFDLVVEQDRVAKITEDLNKMSRRLEIAESAFELQAKELSDSSVAETAQLASDLPKVHALTERFEASECRTAEALQKMLSSIDKVQMLHKGLEGSNRDLTQLVEGLSSRLDRLEAETPQAGDALAFSREDLQTLLAQAQETATSSMHERLSAFNSQSGKDSEMLKALQQELERQKAQLADTVSQEQLSESTKDLTRKVEASEATISASMQTLEDQLTEMLSKSKDSVSDIRATVEDALQRVEATEAASKAVREEIMNEEAHGEAHQLARTCQNDLRGVHSDVADLQASLRSLVRRVEDLHHAGTAGDTRKQVSNGARQLELRVEELQKQVMEELEQLAEQQQLLTKVKPGQLVKPEVQDLEQNVERLAAQVAEELQELQMHQGELGKVRVRLQSDQSKGKAPEVERKISELQHKVLEELEALGKQQEELGKAKVTMADLSDRVQQVVSTVTDCKKATLGMEERLKRLASIEETPGQSAREAPGRGKARFGQDGLKDAELGSDVDDSYGADDFEESAEDASMSEDKAGTLCKRIVLLASAWWTACSWIPAMEDVLVVEICISAQFRQVAASADPQERALCSLRRRALLSFAFLQETCALCRELLELAASGSVIAAERRLHRFAPSSLLSPAEGAMFAAAALPSQFHGAAFRSLLLAAINANDAERAAKFTAGFSKLLPDGSSSMTTQAERESEPLPPSGAEVLGRLLQVEGLTQWLVALEGAGPLGETLQHRCAVHASRSFWDLERALSKALSSSLPVEDAATVRQQALQRLARSPEPLRAELWLRRFEDGASLTSHGLGYVDLRSGLLAAARQGRPRAALRYLRRLMGPLRALRKEQSTAELLDQINLVFLACERGGESSLAEHWLHRIRAAGHPTTAEHFWYSMKAFAKKGLSRDAERLFREMLRCCLEATATEYTMMIRASGKLGDSQRALAWLMRMQAVKLNVDVFAYNAVLGAYAMEGDFRSALKLIKDLESGILHGIKPDAASYAAAANACTSTDSRRSRHHLADVSEQLIERSRSAMVEVDCAVYRRLLRHSARQGDAERVGRLLSRMASCTDPGPSAILEALSACSTAPFLGLAGNLLQKRPGGALLLARPFVELGDWRRLQRLGRDTETATPALQSDTLKSVPIWPMLRLMALSEAVPRKRQKCLEAAADFLLAGGQLSAKTPVSTNGAGTIILAPPQRCFCDVALVVVPFQTGLGGGPHRTQKTCVDEKKKCFPNAHSSKAQAVAGSIVSWRDHEVSPLMRRQEDVRRSMQDRGNIGKPSPQQRYRESAEERGLAAAARLAAAVAAATSHHPAPAVQAHASAEKFRLRRHSTGCRTAPGQPTPSVRNAWTDDRQDVKERAREGQGTESEMRRETRQPRIAPGEVAVAPRVDTSPLRPRLARAQSARRPTRPPAPARARSADPRRRQEGVFGGFVPERREADPSIMEAEKARPSGPVGGIPSPRLHGAQATAARRSTGQILTATVAAVASRRASTGSMSIMDQQPTPFRSLSSKIFSGSYSVAKFLGRGASASVWEAVRSDNEQRVAVKVFDQGQRDKRQAHREMKVLSRVRHPRIVEAFEVIETPRYAQLVCEVLSKLLQARACFECERSHSHNIASIWLAAPWQTVGN